MAFGDTETLSPEEAASLGASKPAAQTLKVVGSESLPQVVGEPVDVFSDVEAFKVWESTQPPAPVMTRVREVAGDLWDGVKGAAKDVASVASGLTSPVPGAKTAALKRGAAVAAEVGAEAYKGFAGLGKGVRAGVQSGLAKANEVNAGVFAASAAAAPAFEDAAVRARMDFYRSARDLQATSNDGRVIADNVMNTVLDIVDAGGSTNPLTDTPVDEAGARFLSNFIDPDMAGVVLRAGARSLFTRAPAIGLIRASERRLASAIAAKAEVEAEVLAAKAAGDAAPAMEARLIESSKQVAAENTYLQKQLATLKSQQAALEEGLGKGYLQRGAGGTTQILGKTVGKIGQWGDLATDKLDTFVTKLGEGGGENVAQGVLRDVPGFVTLRRLSAIGQATGHSIDVAGRVARLPESSLGYFRTLANALPEGTAGRWAASHLERAEFLADTGRWVFDTAEDATRAAGVGAAFGALNGDITGGATQGAIFGLAGSQFGQLARLNSPERVYLLQQQDIAVSRKKRDGMPGGQQKLFDTMPEGLKLAVATVEGAYPNVSVRLARLGKDGVAGSHEIADGISEITLNLDSPAPLTSVLEHETKHFLLRNPEVAKAAEARIIGDPNTGEVGIFVAKDEAGKPIVEEVPDPSNPELTRKQFKLTPEFAGLREQYLQRLRDAGVPSGIITKYETDARWIAQELFAESTSINLLSRQPNGELDLAAARRMGPAQKLAADLLDGSELVANSAFLQRSLTKLGVAFNSLTGEAAPVGLFKKSVEVPEVRRLVEAYNRTRPEARAELPGGEGANAKAYTEAEIMGSSTLSEMFAAGFDAVRDPVTGKMRFVTEKEAKKRAADFVQTLTSELSQYVGNEPGVVREQTVVDANGRESKVWRGTKIPDPVIQKMEESGRFNPDQLKNLRTINKVIELGRGTEVNFLYQPASKRGGRQYRTRPITERTETPTSFVLTKDGNLTITTLSQEKLLRNAVEMVKAGNAPLWNNDFQALWADVQKYVANHQQGLGGAANGLGVEKRDVINALFGQFSKAQRDANPFLQGVAEKTARDRGVVQSRRLDRINKITVLSSEFKPDYAAVSKNYSPSAGAASIATKTPVTETRAFKKWFEGSRVVDAEGQPLRVYHGTNLYQYGDKVLGDITTFERDKSKIKGGKPEFDAVGSWFSASPDAAAIYGKAIYPTYLNLKNPLTMTWAEFMQRGQKGDPKWTNKNLAKKGEVPMYMAEGAWNPEGLRTWLKEQGYDGIKFPASEKVDGQPHDVYVALEPEQIKSAIGNKGTFDPTNPDIRFSPAAH
jgi:hypothetical protein